MGEPECDNTKWRQSDKENIIRHLLNVGSKRMTQMHLFTKTETIYKNKNLFTKTQT